MDILFVSCLCQRARGQLSEKDVKNCALIQ